MKPWQFEDVVWSLILPFHKFGLVIIATILNCIVLYLMHKYVARIVYLQKLPRIGLQNHQSTSKTLHHFPFYAKVYS